VAGRRKRTPRRKGVARKQAIVDAAIDLIAENGTDPLSHRAAARRAGVPDSAPSYYFESIEELTVEAFRAAIRAFVERIDGLRESVERTAMSPEDAIGAYVAGAPAAARETRLQFEAYLYATKHPEVRGEVVAAIDAMTSAAEGVIRAIGRPDLCWAAPIVVAFVDGYTIQRLVKPEDGYEGLEDGLLALLRGLDSRTA
jgi:TetR/AcrR family transcriptional regulator, regulator of biofilm formation and stress response